MKKSRKMGIMVPVVFDSQDHRRPEQPVPPAPWSCSGLGLGLGAGLVCCMEKSVLVLVDPYQRLKKHLLLGKQTLMD